MSRRARPDPWLVVASVLVLAGLAVGGRFAWVYGGTSWVADRQQAADLAAFDDAHARAAAGVTPRVDVAAPVPTDLDGVWGTLWVPAWAGRAGARGEVLDARTPIREGLSEQVLRAGSAGRFPESALPGQVGNLVLGGHRRTYGDNFLHVDKLRTGDAVVVETAQAWYVYEVAVEPYLVLPSEGAAVLDDAPAGLPAAGRYATLVSCHSTRTAEWGNDHRMVVHAVLVGWLLRSEGTPHHVADLLAAG